MTVLTATAKAGPYAGSGTTGPFPVPFRFLEAGHLRVIRTSTTGVDADLLLGTDYTVSGVGASSGSVTLVVALAVGEKLTVVRSVPATQQADYVAGDGFPAESHEQALDLLTMIAQQHGEQLGRAVMVPLSSSETPAAFSASLFDARAQAVEAAASALQSEQSAEADRAQTLLDRQATAADRLQTGLDAQATAADRAQTGLDRIATGQDRVQTGQDAAASSQSAADALLSEQAAAASADSFAINFTSLATQIIRTQAVVATHHEFNDAVPYADLSGVPSTFPPAAHGHAIADVTGLQTALDGKQPLAAVLTNTTASFTAAQESKLAGIAPAATANSTDAQLRDRATHTGTQTAATISDFAAASRAQTEAELVAGTNVTITPSGTGASRQLTIAASVGGGGATNLSTTAAPTTVTINSDTGTDATIAAADGNNAGLILPGEKTKLAGIATGATANSPDATLLARANHTGTQPAATISDFAAAVGATAAVTANTAKVSNANHTGDVTGDTALTIANNAVTNTKAADMATATIKGRVTAGTGDPEDLMPAQAKTLLAIVSSDLSDFASAADARIAASNRVQSNTAGITGADQITNMFSLTQAEYDAIGTKNAATLYVIA